MCNDSFDSPLLMKDHILKNHGGLKIYNAFVKNMTEKTQFKPLDSSENKKRGGKNSEELIREEKNVEDINEKIPKMSKYECTICGKPFKTVNNFVNHSVKAHADTNQ